MDPDIMQFKPVAPALPTGELGFERTWGRRAMRRIRVVLLSRVGVRWWVSTPQPAVPTGSLGGDV